MKTLFLLLALFSAVGAQNITCELCMSMIHKTENLLYLADEYAAFACGVLQPPDRPACVEMAQAVIPFAIVQVVENYSPETVCRYLEYCPRRRWFWK